MPSSVVSNPLLSLEHRVLRALATTAPERRWLIAVSGGVDSMVLAEIIRRWRRKLCDRIVFAHVHHGRGVAFRDQARDRVAAWARAHRLPFVTNAPPALGPTSENEARLFRYTHLNRWRARYGLDLILLGHHRDDLIETRLLRLLRGTGRGGLTGMRPRFGRRVRPMLDLSRAEIADYARARDLTWLEDPSNARPDANLRAWIRHAWIPALETRCPGASRALARSLELGLDTTPAPDMGALTGVRRAAFAGLSHASKARAVVAYLTSVGARGYGRDHVLELIKRLDTDRKEFTFRLLGHDFYVRRHVWWASRGCDWPVPC